MNIFTRITQHRVLLATLGVCVLAIGGGVLWRLNQEPLSWEERVQECGAYTPKEECYATLMREVRDRESLVRAFEILKVIVQKESDTRSDSDFFKACHQFTHDIGRDAYDQLAHTGGIPALPYGDLCSYGFYHGFMERLIHEGGTPAEARRMCEMLEARVVESASTLDSTPCYHGIGHGAVDGFTDGTKGDPEALIRPGKDMCRFVGEGDEDRVTWCLTGAFHSLAHMYEYETFGLSAYGDGFNPYAICMQQERESERIACYQQMRSVAQAAAGHSLEGALRFAQAVSDVHYARIAVRGIAEHEAQLFRGATAEEYIPVYAACAMLEEELEEMCVQSFGAGLFIYSEPGNELSNALSFCQSDRASKTSQHLCLYNVLLHARGKLSKIEYERQCYAALTDTNRAYCEEVYAL